MKISHLYDDVLIIVSTCYFDKGINLELIGVKIYVDYKKSCCSTVCSSSFFMIHMERKKRIGVDGSELTRYNVPVSQGTFILDDG